MKISILLLGLFLFNISSAQVRLSVDKPKFDTQHFIDFIKSDRMYMTHLALNRTIVWQLSLYEHGVVYTDYLVKRDDLINRGVVIYTLKTEGYIDEAGQWIYPENGALMGKSFEYDPSMTIEDLEYDRLKEKQRNAFRPVAYPLEFHH